MKKSISTFTFVSALFLFFTVQICAADTPWDMKLPFKEAIISYSLSGAQNGSETLYIRNYGKERACYTKSTQNIMYVTTTTETIEITTPEWIYTIDMAEQSGSKVTNPIKYMIEEYNRLSSAEKKMVKKNAEEMGMSSMTGMQGDVQQNAEKILGYSCDRVSVAGTTVYSIHGTGIPLRSETNTMGMRFFSVATDIQKKSVDANRFTPPANISIRHDQQADAMARAMAINTIEALKSPDAKQKMMQQGGGVPMNQQQHEDGSDNAATGTQQPPSQDHPGVQQEMHKAIDALRGLFRK